MDSLIIEFFVSIILLLVIIMITNLTFYIYVSKQVLEISRDVKEMKIKFKKDK